MEYRIEEVVGCLRKYSFVFNWDEIEGEYEKVVEEVAKEAEVPGFRKGKAPIELVKSKYKNPIEDELKRKFLYKAADEIVKSEDLKLFSDPFADNPVLEEGKTIKGVIFFEVFPEVPEIDTSNITIEVPKIEFSDKDVYENAKLYQIQNAEIKTFDKTKVESGDFCSAEIFREGNEDKKEQIFIRCDEKSLNEIEKFLVGKECGQNYEIEIKEDKNYPEGKYRINVINVVRRVLPPLDDNLAVKCGFQSLDDLLAKVRENTEKDARLKEKDECFKRIMNELLNRYQFDVPNSLVERQLMRDLENIRNFLEKQGQNLSSFDWEKYIEVRRVEVEKNIRAYFIVNKLIEQENIDVNEEEIDSFLKEIAERQGVSQAKLKQVLTERGQMEEIKFRLKEEKVLEKVLKNVKIEYVVNSPQNENGGKNVNTDSD